ncbi:alpha/beta fold hydrolase [Flammeovirga kamogawensis]|uniref:Alpha/beta hydrolase n=1 Tax=Flammeovirga kamogawensis TaxID=373891 RepID=A0ABX8H429_9BACT|nr:alpha/beta hydrolase [Flammeovirga kamogawensis]MBB6460516.1 pimeloyl-ACP methyl ester carboxylesterase [Flammeovirga kamogawensis]QWG10322.1 alpha/beta hydrolase [Flammeovirga kamogawensis]TRX64768.1 alpha/beta hydrolase [Flammeovirga kamogawensis]
MTKVLNRITLLLLVLFISNLSFGQNQKQIRFLKKELDVTAYQNQELSIKLICKASDSSKVIIRAFFDSKDNEYISYKTIDSNSKQLDNSWISYSGKIKIPKKAAKLDLGAMTFTFPESISIANLSVFSESGEIYNTSNHFDFDEINYSKNEDKSLTYNEKPTIKLTINNQVLYGNNSQEGKYVKLNGIDFYYEVYGKGEPILLLHGNNESINAFRFQIDKLKENYKVIVVDSRCQGRSSCDKTKLSYKQMASDMSALLDFLNLDKVTILGWSDGGNTGLEFALQYPEKVKSLITMGANLFPTEEAIKPEVLKQLKHSVRVNKSMGIFYKYLRRYGKVGEICLKYPDMSPEDLNTIRIPVLVLAGENDVIVDEHTKLIANSLPNSELYIFPNQGHYAPIECPEDFNNAVIQFLQKIDDDTTSTNILNN